MSRRFHASQGAPNQACLQELKKRYPDGLPRLDPVDDMGIRDTRVAAAVRSIERMEKELADNEVFKVPSPPGKTCHWQAGETLLCLRDPDLALRG